MVTGRWRRSAGFSDPPVVPLLLSQRVAQLHIVGFVLLQQGLPVLFGGLDQAFLKVLNLQQQTVHLEGQRCMWDLGVWTRSDPTRPQISPTFSTV